MSRAFKQLLLCLGFAVGLSFQQLVIPTTGTVDTLEHPFIIELGGAYVAEVESNFERQIPARIGHNPAVFTLKDGRLSSRPWVMGRAMMENRSLLPKEVYWFNETTPGERGIPDPTWRDFYSVTAQRSGESIKLLFPGGLIVQNGDQVFADILHESELRPLNLPTLKQANGE